MSEDKIGEDIWEIDQGIFSLLSRFVTAFESLAETAKGTYEEGKRISQRLWPERVERREAKLSRVPTEDDKAREDQGAADTRPIQEWATSFADEHEGDVVGFRERQYNRRHPEGPGTKAGGQAG